MRKLARCQNSVHIRNTWHALFWQGLIDKGLSLTQHEMLGSPAVLEVVDERRVHIA